MTRPMHSSASQLNAARLALANSRSDPEIAAGVALFGYPEARLAEGQCLYERALAAVDAQKAAAAAQLQATADLELSAGVAHDAYQALAKVARAVADRSSLTVPGLEGREPRTTAGFILAGYTLFSSAATLPQLASFGYDDDRLITEREKIAAYDRLNQQQEAAKGAAQQATREAEMALADLAIWLGQYLKIARVALRGRPQLFEKLGIVVQSQERA